MTTTNTQYSDEVTIRAVEAEDIGAIKEIIHANNLFPSSMLDDMLKGYFNGSNSDDHWLILDKVLPLAVAYYTSERMTDGTWNLLLIAVHPAHQSKGLGTTLLGFIEHQLIEEMQRLLIVETSGLPQFENARCFYERYGFVKEAVIRDFYQAGEDKITLTKAITCKSAVC